MSSVPRSHRTTPLWVRLRAALETSLVVQRGRMSALMKEAERRGEHYLTYRSASNRDDGAVDDQ